MQFIQGDLFKDFPTLRFVISAWRRRGALPLGTLSRARRHAEASAARWPRDENGSSTLFYHQRASICVKVIDPDNILFGSEMVGAVRGIDPTTGQYFATQNYLDALTISAAAKQKIFEATWRRVYPRLDARLRTRA